MTILQNELIKFFNDTSGTRVCGMLDSMIIRSECYKDVSDLVKMELFSMALGRLNGNQIRFSAELDSDLVFDHFSRSKLPSEAIQSHLIDVLGSDCTYLFSFRSNVSSPTDKVELSLIVLSDLSSSSFIENSKKQLLENGVFASLDLETDPIQPLCDAKFGYSTSGVSAWVLEALHDPKKIRKCFDYNFQEEFDGEVLPLKKTRKGAIISDARGDAGLNRRRVEFYQLIDLISVSADVKQLAEELWPELQSSVVERLHTLLFSDAA